MERHTLFCRRTFFSAEKVFSFTKKTYSYTSFYKNVVSKRLQGPDLHNLVCD